MRTALKVVSIVAVAVTLLIGALWAALYRRDLDWKTLDSKYGGDRMAFAKTADGLEINYRDEGASTGSAIVLVHGYASSSADWAPWAARLGNRRRVISIDLPGHGLTRAPKNYVATPDMFVRSIDAVADTLHLTRFAIAGNSMGGVAAFNYALARPDRVEALILVDSAGWPRLAQEGSPVFKLLQNPVLGPALRDLDSTALTTKGLRDAFADPKRATPEMVQRYVDLSRAPGHRPIMMQLVNGAGAHPANEADLARLRTPTLIMHGLEDHLIPVDHGKRFAKAIFGAELVLYPGVGHMPQLEAPDKSAADVETFLDRVTTPFDLGGVPLAKVMP